MEYGLIGAKLGHSFSREIHARIADYDYELCELSPDGVAELMNERSFRAINVTIPYKETVIPMLDVISENAAKIGAVNTVVNRGGRLYGYNTDYAGASALIRRAGVEIKDKKVLILGTGGTSKTMRAVVGDMGAASVIVSIVALSQAANGAFGLDRNAQKGFIVVGMAMTVVASLLFELAGIGTRERVPNSGETKTMKESFALMWRCKPFRRILISGLLRSPIQLMMTVVMTLFSYYYCEGDLTTAFTDVHRLVIVIIVGGGFFVGQFAATIICPALMKKLDIKTMYNLTGLAGLPTALVFATFLVAPTELAKIGWVAIDGVLLLCSGAGIGAVNVCQSVMISDCIDYEEYTNGYRPDGIFFSGQSFITKFSAGIASIISAYVFAAVGYTDVNIDAMNKALANGASFAKDYGEYSWAMWFLITVPPAIGMVLAILPTLKYEITKEQHQKMLSELIERHKKEKNT